MEQADFFKQARSILVYHPFDFELNFIRPLINSYPDKNYYFPKTSGEDLFFVSAKIDSHFSKNKFGILEPILGKALNLQDLTHNLKPLVLVPSMSVDTNLNRLGRGKGYYDRFLARLPAFVYKLAIIPDFAFSRLLSTDKWDIRLDALGVVSINSFSLYKI